MDADIFINGLIYSMNANMGGSYKNETWQNIKPILL